MDAEIVARVKRDLILSLQDDLYVSDVGLVDGLIEEGYLSSNDWQAIHRVLRHKKKVKILINSLAKTPRPDNAFMCLLEKLKISHEHLVPVVSRVLGRAGKLGNTSTHRPEAVEHEDITNGTHVAFTPNYHGNKQETSNKTNMSLKTGERCPSSVKGNDHNGRTQVATEMSWSSSLHNNNSRCEVIQKTNHLSYSLPVVACVLGHVGKLGTTPTHRPEAVEHEDITNETHVVSLNDEIPNYLGDIQETSNNTLASSSDTDSEMNTDVLTSELDEQELSSRGFIEGGDISDVVDVCIQAGVLSSDDYNLIHGTASKRRKTAILTRLLSQNSEKCVHLSNGLKNPSGNCEQTNVDVIDAAVSHVEETDSIALLRRALYVLPSSGQTVIKDLDVVFDKYNAMLNNGMLQVDELPENPNVQCILHYLKACAYLYQAKYELAKKHIKTTDTLLPKTDYQIQLRSQIFTAKTWLCLRTDKLGKMLQLLEENEQNMKSFPEHWPNTAKGWFYYDYCRCYEAMLKRILFNDTGKDNRNIRPREYYRQRAIESAKRAVDYFRVSDSSDGPIGSGFALRRLADLHLLSYSNTPVTKIGITEQDLKTAETAITEVEHVFGEIPEVLKSHFLITKCRFMIRAGIFSKAYELAIEGGKSSERLQISHCIKESAFLLDYIRHLNGNRCDIKHLEFF